MAWRDILFYGTGAIIALGCFGYALYLMHESRKPEGCWYKSTGHLRDDNLRAMHRRKKRDVSAKGKKPLKYPKMK